MKIALYSQTYKDDYNNAFNLIFRNLIENNDTIFIEETLWKHFSEKNKINYPVSVFSSEKELNASIDIMLTIGGDGTILRAITYVGRLSIPILGINAGRLGFLATISENEIQQMFTCIRQKNYRIQKRSIIEVVTQDNEPISTHNFALNEICVTRKNTTSMITIETYLDNEYLTSYWADGLIIATPTGSTGYSLSCGGPVIMPDANNLVLTPIAPHNLNARPLVIPDKKEITMLVSSREEFYFVSADTHLKSLSCRKKIKVRKADFCLNMIELEHHSFLKTLRNKLLWGEDVRN